jgi:hypothetical protein
MPTVGVDPGQKNLALCMVDGQKIIRWVVINILPDPKGIADGLANINFEDWVRESTDVVIERQPTRNPRAVRIQICIEMYCAMHGGRCYQIDAKHKLSYASSTQFWPDREITNWTYNQRKKLSVETVSNFLKATEQDEQFVTMFEKSKKKDDLADALLHCLAFDENIKPMMNKDRRRPIRNIKPVKPSVSNTKSKKYTQGNLKFIAKTWLSTFDIFQMNGENTPGFLESCYRHFNDMDDAFLQLGGKL